MSVLAIYRGRVYDVGDNLNECELRGGPTVGFGDEDLTNEPTDAEIATAENLGEFYGVDASALDELRQTLRGR